MRTATNEAISLEPNLVLGGILCVATAGALAVVFPAMLFGNGFASDVLFVTDVTNNGLIEKWKWARVHLVILFSVVFATNHSPCKAEAES